MDHTVLPAINTIPAVYLVSVHQMAPPSIDCMDAVNFCIFFCCVLVCVVYVKQFASEHWREVRILDISLFLLKFFVERYVTQ